jgi:FKBP-type peptidyl-prolyl cis-trans isomerase 2
MKKTLSVISTAFLLILLIFLLTACHNESTVQIQPGQPEPAAVQTDLSGIQKGDLVEMNFVLYGEDGGVIDTNNKELAEQAKLKTYSPGKYQFIVGRSGKVKGFDEAVLTLNKGDKKTLTIAPTEQKLEIEFNRTNIQPRMKTIPRKQNFRLDNFEKIFKKPPIVNDVISNKDMFAWPFRILAITNNTVQGEVMIEEGDDVQIPGTQWMSKAITVSELAIQFLQNPKQGQIIETEFGTAVMNVSRSRVLTFHNPVLGKEFLYTVPSAELISPRYEFKITEIKDDSFTITRANHPAQEMLKLEVEIINVVPAGTITKIG